MLLPAFQNSTLCLHMSKLKWEGDLLLHVILHVISRASLHNYFVELDKMQVNIQGVEHDLRRIPRDELNNFTQDCIITKITQCVM